MLEFNAPLPRLAGARCSALLAQEFWHAGERVSPANALFLAVEGGAWHRIAIDCGIVFWRIETEPSLPGPEMDSDQYGQHPLVDIGAQYGLVGRQIQDVWAAQQREGDELLIQFENGPVVVLRALRDRDVTDLEIRAPAA